MKKLLLFLFLLSVLLPITADERTEAEAARIAAEFTNSQPSLARAHRAPRKAASMKMAYRCPKKDNDAPAFYVFNQEDNAGYVIVSGDDRTEDVLLYTEQGQFDISKTNPNLRFWLNRLQEEITQANDSNAVDKTAPRKAVTAIGPLLVNDKGKAIAWYQEAPYNNLCPTDKYDNTKCLTGCVATAAAQVLYKWRYPEKGTGSKTYTWYNCLDDYCKNYSEKNLSANFGATTYDWANMLPAYEGVSATSAQKNAVATLMYQLGVACEMEYGGDKIGGSGAFTDMMGDGLRKYFGYRVGKFITQYSKSGYNSDGYQCAMSDVAEYNVTTEQFVQYFNEDLEAGRPVIMGGESSDGGHEFVCDGRNSSGYFHINWGWEGDGNCYCLLSSLKPSGYSYKFSTNIDALIGVEPSNREIIKVTGVTVAPATLTLKINEKQSVTATVAPANAFTKTVTWASSNTGVATVSETGVVKGKAQGTATITATTKDGGFKASCAVTVTSEVAEISGCDDYSYTFTTKCQKGENTLGDYTWNISLENGNIESIDKDRGQQFGSKKNPALQVSLTTDNPADCTIGEIIINAAMASNGDSKLAIYIGGKQIGSAASLSTSAADYTFKNTSGEQGALEIRITNTKSAAYIRTINLIGDVEGGGGDDDDDDDVVFPTTITELDYLDAYLMEDYIGEYWDMILYRGKANGGLPMLMFTGIEMLSETKLAGEYISEFGCYWVSDKDSIFLYDIQFTITYLGGTISSYNLPKYSVTGTAYDEDDNLYTFTATIGGSAYDLSEEEITLTDEVGGSGDDDDDDKPTGDFTRLTKVSSIEENDEIIIVAADANVALSTTQNTNNRGTASVTKSGNTCKPSSSVQVITLTEGNKGGTFGFKAGNGYLSAASSTKNLLHTNDNLSDVGSWTISIANGVTTVQAGGSFTRNTLLFNAGNKPQLFSCYLPTSTSMGAVTIYYRKASSTAIQNPETKNTACKVIENGCVYILRDGVRYTMLGQRVIER
ncbi:MAG: C10 family peptidase [Paludibacteraceae bacterium]|nr:C10 family peptidase [Paludibacteraceae bacterium]